MESNKIRQAFLDFFQSKGHTIVPSAPMVVKNDPTLMFTNAGMNQFKDIFLGNAPRQYPRAADTQKCLRVSGKHNDLEEVGHDTYHHTMFEMLGNWSFGDYFKKEAIAWAWELLTEVYGLDKSRMYATVFEGSADDGVPFDEEAYGYWREYLPEDHIIKGNKHDNFWEMGETGPCGPCSEIHFDLRDEADIAAIPGRDMVNAGHHLVIEIWNLVFMQYNRKADGSLEPLPAKVIDTGMGFERLCMALQGKTSNYDTDVFTPLIGKIAELSGKRYGDDRKVDIAMRVIADHVRTIAFSIADSQLPGNAKAGYVIRRILRRAVRYAYTFLGQKQAFMYRLVDTLIDSMGEAYPELPAQRELIMRVIKEEEDSFLRTLENGIRMLDNAIAAAKAAGKTEIDGKEAFVLYDTYGFPLDLTELILKENGMTLDQAGFDREMQAQKERARNAAATSADDWTVISEGEPEFVGYDLTECSTRILRYRKVSQKKGDFYQIVLAQSPFYAEMGGQVGDRGTLTSADGEVIEIYDTKRENGMAVHLAKKLPANPEVIFEARIDVNARMATSCNHTATHLLHQALRQVLGTHVEQRGSFVSPQLLRFDFSHFQKLTPEQIREVEHIANANVRRAIPLDEHRSVPIAAARDMGAMALFGEKYGEEVRVIRYGDSIELCGGTHVANTGNIGMIRVISESSIAAGIRRIEAITGEAVENTIDEMSTTLREMSSMFNNAPDVVAAVRKAIAENSDLHKEVEEYFKERCNTLVGQALGKAEKHGDITIVKFGGVRVPELVKNVAFGVRAVSPEKTVFLAATVDMLGKPLLTVMVTEDLTKQGLNASAMVREAAKKIQGGGGGQPGFAQAGGKNPEGVAEAFEVLQSLVK